jgi:hypothetical protein
MSIEIGREPGDLVVRELNKRCAGSGSQHRRCTEVNGAVLPLVATVNEHL